MTQRESNAFFLARHDIERAVRALSKVENPESLALRLVLEGACRIASTLERLPVDCEAASHAVPMSETPSPALPAGLSAVLNNCGRCGHPLSWHGGPLGCNGTNYGVMCGCATDPADNPKACGDTTERELAHAFEPSHAATDC